MTIRKIALGGGGGDVNWGDIGGTLSSQTDLQNALNDKQDELVSATNIKTINGASILGSGNLVVTGDGGISAVAIVGANGITGASVNTLGVANVTLVLGAITPTSVNSIVLSGSSTPTLSVTGTSSISGANTGDETTASIQTKRPLKTIEGQSLEGAGNIDLTKSDVGLSNVDNTSDASKPISTATQTALDAKQATLVSATNIKTINGSSILGSGDLTIGASLTSAEAFCTAETTLSAATYADITGSSISLTAGTWIIFATANGSSQTTTATSMIVAITDSANAVIAEAAQDIAAGTATVRTWGNLSLSAIVTPTGTTTYKLRGARGQTTRTGNCIISDGTGQGTANNVSNNSDKSTSIRAIKIA